MAEPDVARSAAPAVPLTRRASLNVAAFGLDFGVKTAVGLLVTPLLVGRLGTTLFGAWEMLDRLAGYVATVGGRPSEALRLLVANRPTIADPAAPRRAGGVAGAQVALAALSALCFWWLARTYVVWFGARRPARAETRSLASFAAWLAGGDLIAKLLLGSDVLILGTLLSPAAVTTYVLTAYAPRAAVAVHGSAVGAAMPGLAGLIGEGQYERAALARGDLMILTWLFATAVGTTILLWNRSFVALWVGAEHYGGAVGGLLIGWIAVQTAFIPAAAFIIDAALRAWLRVLIAAVTAVVTITLAVALAPALRIARLCLRALPRPLIP